MTDFIKFRDAVNAKFARMCQEGEVFTVGVDGRTCLDSVAKALYKSLNETEN